MSDVEKKLREIHRLATLACDPAPRAPVLRCSLDERTGKLAWGVEVCMGTHLTPTLDEALDVALARCRMLVKTRASELRATLAALDAEVCQ